MFKHQCAILIVVLLFACGRIAQAQYTTTKPILEPTVFAPGVIYSRDLKTKLDPYPRGSLLIQKND